MSATPSEEESATPNEMPSVGPSPTPLSSPDIETTREEVVRRINGLPGITAEEKANLIDKMRKASSMERLVVVPFDIGQTSLRRAAADEIVRTFEKPEMRNKLSDPTVLMH